MADKDTDRSDDLREGVGCFFILIGLAILILALAKACTMIPRG